MRRWIAVGCVGVVCAVALSSGAHGGSAANPKIWVTAAADVADPNPGDGLCRVKLLAKPGTPPRCTLRAAIQTANARPGADIVVLPAGVFRLAVHGVGEGAARKGDLDVTSGPLVVLGKGPGQTIVDADGLDRLFEVHPLGGNLLLQSLELRGGSPASAQDGGAVLVAGALATRNVVLRSNRVHATGNAVPPSGGAIHVAKNASATLERTSLVGNEAPFGAALSVRGTASLLNVTISDNVVTSPAVGGAVDVMGVLRIVHSTIVAPGGWAIRYSSAGARVDQLASIVVGPCNARDATFLGAGNAVTHADCAPAGTATSNGVSDTVFTDVGLAPLGSGPLPVHLLRAGSPAIDRARGVPEVCPPADALGQARPFGRACDAGAIENRLRRTP
jgi:CSLREA domain-containing protein